MLEFEFILVERLQADGWRELRNDTGHPVMDPLQVLRLLQADEILDEVGEFFERQAGFQSFRHQGDFTRPLFLDLRGQDADGFGVSALTGCLAVSAASRCLPSSVNTKRPPRVRLISPIDISSSRASLDKNLASPLATRRSEL